MWDRGKVGQSIDFGCYSSSLSKIAIPRIKKELLQLKGDAPP